MSKNTFGEHFQAIEFQGFGIFPRFQGIKIWVLTKFLIFQSFFLEF